VRIVRSIWRDHEGSALAEGAVLVPVLIILLLGVYDFSWYFYQQHLIATGLRDAAHYLARSANPSDATTQSDAKNLAVTGQITGGSARVPGWSTSNVQVAISSDANSGSSTPCGAVPCRGGATIQLITVCTGTTSTTQSCSSTSFSDPSFGIFGILGLTVPVFNVSHSERYIGPG